jgi:hypothetical protein
MPTRLRHHQGNSWNTEGCLCFSIYPRFFAEDGANARLTAHAPPAETPKVNIGFTTSGSGLVIQHSLK